MVMSAELHNDLNIWIIIIRPHLLSKVSEVDRDNASNDNVFLDLHWQGFGIVTT